MSSAIGLGNGPCSWGVLEFDGASSEQIGFEQMLDELAATGYAGTELGDWGYMPTDPRRLSDELARRSLTLLGGFVPVALKHEERHGAGEAHALEVAGLLAAVAAMGGGDQAPFLVLSDANGADPVRTKHAGRVSAAMSLRPWQWTTFARGVERIAHAVKDETGLATVFHPHCGGYVETPGEIEHLLSRTDPDLVGLAFDTGHYAYGAGQDDVDVAAALERWGARVWYVHLKDCDPVLAREARAHGWDYFEAIRRGLFCELGQGCVEFPAVIDWLRRHNHRWALVEQDVVARLGTPKESAERNRRYLASLGL